MTNDTQIPNELLGIFRSPVTKTSTKIATIFNG